MDLLYKKKITKNNFLTLCCHRTSKLQKKFAFLTVFVYSIQCLVEIQLSFHALSAHLRLHDLKIAKIGKEDGYSTSGYISHPAGADFAKYLTLIYHYFSSIV